MPMYMWTFITCFADSQSVDASVSKYESSLPDQPSFSELAAKLQIKKWHPEYHSDECTAIDHTSGVTISNYGRISIGDFVGPSIKKLDADQVEAFERMLNGETFYILPFIKLF